MKRNSAGTPHLTTKLVLDYLDGHLSLPLQQRLEQHLASPCPECREHLRSVGSVRDRMRDDRTPEVPGWLHAKALVAFNPPPRTWTGGDMLERLAHLVFDSWSSPLPTAARRAVGEARRLRFQMGEMLLELEWELESEGLATLRGKLRASDPAAYQLVLRSGNELRETWPDALGAFLLEGLPAVRFELVVIGPEGMFRVPSQET